MKVFVVGNDPSVENMWLLFGASICSNLDAADLVQFTGGEDVSPHLYGQHAHSTTWFNRERDTREIAIFKIAQKRGIPMAGICRGGQFLNVMNGGQMWQDVNGHAVGSVHSAVDRFTGETFKVTSTHHQMMIPGKEGVVVVEAQCATRKEMCTSIGTGKATISEAVLQPDVEAVFYSKNKCFCFQPHPEYTWVAPNLAEIYMEYLEDYLKIKVPGAKGKN